MISEPTLHAMKILIVDDEPANLALLQYVLLGTGFTQLRTTTNPRGVREIYDEFAPDLILLDLMMPGIDGFEVMRQLGERVQPDDCLPILVLTADVSSETRHRALSVGASDFLTKPFDPVEVLLRIRHLLHIRAQHQQLARQKDTLEETVAARTGEMRSTLGQLEETVARLRDTQQQVIQHERMSALGSMAAGLAHDFNNALSLILGYSELLQAELKGSPFEEQSDDYLGTIITAGQDAAKMFNRLRDFYRPSDGDAPSFPVDLNEMVERAVALTRPRWHGQAYLKILRHYLTGAGHQVETATDGREALEKFRAADRDGAGFELVITDKAMPGMNGEQLAAGVKAQTPGTAVILLTGMGTSDDKDACHWAIDRVLLKPITQAVLRSSVRQVMAGRGDGASIAVDA